MGQQFGGTAECLGVREESEPGPFGPSPAGFREGGLSRECPAREVAVNSGCNYAFNHAGRGLFQNI